MFTTVRLRLALLDRGQHRQAAEAATRAAAEKRGVTRLQPHSPLTPIPEVSPQYTLADWRVCSSAQAASRKRTNCDARQAMCDKLEFYTIPNSRTAK